MFDKASYHLASVRRHGLDDHQAGVHLGLLFGWAVQRGLTAAWLEDRTPDAFEAFRARRITGPELVARWDGMLVDDMFSDEGLAFAEAYLHTRPGGYVQDYREAIARSLASEFHVPDSWASFDAVVALLDRRHTAWRATWDPSSGRPDLRAGHHDGPEPLPDRLTVAVVPVTGGVALPGGPLGLVATRPETVAALREAADGHGWVGLFPTLSGSSPADVHDLGPVGVAARVQTRADRDGAVEVILGCRDRIERDHVTADAGAPWRTAVHRMPVARTGPDDAAVLEEIRSLVAEVLRGRRQRGEPVGRLAVAIGLSGAGLVDAVAQDLGLAHQELLVVLEEPTLAGRAQTVRAALWRARE